MTPTSANEDQPVRDAFVQWVSLQAGAPRNPASLIEHVAISHDPVGLLDTEVQGRRVVWKVVPAAAKARVTTPTVEIDAVDPWSVETASLRQRSDHIAICGTCAGERKVRCAPCAGSGKTLCGGCNGQRKVYGYAANGAYRLLNCTTCRGKGEVDCSACRRGIAVCSECAGEGRLQRWMEVESWRRSVSLAHPQSVALQFGWGDSPSTETVARDAAPVVDIDRPYRLTAPDLGRVPEEWLATLATQLMPGERVARQRLRIARVPKCTVHFRLGADEGRISFYGLRLIGPQSAEGSAFAKRATRLRSLLFLLLATGSVIALASLGRGLFFWSISTLLSLLACDAALIAIYAAAVDWTAARRHTQRWLIAAASSLVVAIAFAMAALPRVGHARRLIATAKLDAAESELNALGPKVSGSTWADLRLERVRQATEIDAACSELARIPRELPQHAAATNAFDRLVLQTVRDAVQRKRWSDASGALAFLSEGARKQPESGAAATTVYVPLARDRIAHTDWPGAANAILSARRLGVASFELQPFVIAIDAAALDRTTEAKRETDPRRRLEERLAAEAIFVSWERATESWGTPPLIALRTAMARDIIAAERGKRRRRER